MRIGVRAHDYGKNTPKDLAHILSKEGFGAAQLAISKAIIGVNDYLEVTDVHLSDIKEEFEQNNIEISVLGCYIEPSLRDEKERLKQVAIFEKYLEFSLKVNAKLVGTETSRFSYEESDRNNVFHILEDSVLRMIDKAQNIGAFVGIEPVAVHTLNSPELTHKLIQRVNNKHLKIIFDPVNMITLTNMHEQDKLWKDCFQAFGQEINVIHLKDFIVKDGQMIPTLLGEGLLEYEYLFEWLHKNKPDISILREEINPLTASKDIQFMKRIVQKG